MLFRLIVGGSLIGILSTASEGQSLQGTVKAVVDYPDSCSGTLESGLGSIEVSISDSVNPPKIGSTNSAGAFDIDVSGLNPGPYKVKVSLRSVRSDTQLVFRVENANGPNSQVEARCSLISPCNLLFSDLNSSPAERTTYYWLRRAIDAIETNSLASTCPRFGAGGAGGQAFTANVNVPPGCNATDATINLPREGFPCGNAGRVASIIMHELNHRLENLTAGQPVVCELGGGDASEARSDAFALMVLALNGIDEPVTGRGFYRSKCLFGIRQHDVLRRETEDTFFGADGEIVSGFFWDVIQSVPDSSAVADIVRAYLNLVCDDGAVSSNYDVLTDSFCSHCTGGCAKFDSQLLAAANAHGLEWCTRIVPRTTDQVTKVEAIDPPFTYEVFPTPFKPEVNIEVAMKTDSELRITIYDIQGRLVGNIHDGQISRGSHSFYWGGADRNGDAVSSGIYVVLLDSGTYRTARKVLRIQ